MAFGARKTKEKLSCLAKAMDYLARSDQSKNRLMDKLKRCKYSESEIEDAITYLEEKRYIREEDGCQRRFQNMYEAENCSVRQICVKLVQQGYERDMVEDCIPEYVDEHEENAAYRIVSHKFKKDTDPRKMMQYLYTKGFQYDNAQSAVEKLMAEWEE